jgi:hypothetical protein
MALSVMLSKFGGIISGTLDPEWVEYKHKGKADNEAR